MNRTILHCDMNSFYASVELLDYPELKNKPVAVCGDPQNRHGIILAKNEFAKSFGVVTAETINSAKKKCPMLKIIPPHREKYIYYSKLINEIYQRYTDLVEPFSIDESWLDVSASMNLFGNGMKIADEIRATAKKELGLTLSAGVAFNKVMAKMGSEYKKPDATTLITPDNFKSLLWHKPVSELFFVGKSASDKLNSIGVFTIGELAVSEKEIIANLLGKHGKMIHDYANGIDDSPVTPFDKNTKAHSIGHGITFKRNLISQRDIETAVIGLSDKVASRLRKNNLLALGIKIDITDTGFKTISRQSQLSEAANSADIISKKVLELLKNNWESNKPIRLLSVTGINLIREDEPVQLSLFDKVEKKNAKNPKLDTAIDDIRKKFGSSSILHGCLLNNDIGISVKDEQEYKDFIKK